MGLQFNRYTPRFAVFFYTKKGGSHGLGSIERLLFSDLLAWTFAGALASKLRIVALAQIHSC